MKDSETARALTEAFPDLAPVAPLQLLGEGFRSRAVATASGAVIRIGKQPEAAADYAREWRLLPALRPHLSVAIPEPQWYTAPTDAFPHGALGYPRLPGRTPAEVDVGLARDLAQFLVELHDLPLALGARAGLPTIDARQRLLQARPVVQPVLRERLTPPEANRLEQWWDQLVADPQMRVPALTVCHHDLWRDNLLTNEEGRLTAVLDFAHAEIADPAQDFAAPHEFGDAFAVDVLQTYRRNRGVWDEHLPHRSQRYWEGRPLGGLAWAIEHEDREETNAALRKIRGGAILGHRA